MIAAISFVLSCNPHDRGQTEVIRNSLKRSLDFADADAGSAKPRDVRLIDPARRTARYLVAQLDAVPVERMRPALVAAGLRAVAHLPGNAVLLERIATGTPEAEQLVAARVRTLRPYTAVDRVSREFRSTLGVRAAIGVPILIHVMPGQDSTSLRNVLSKYRLPLLGQRRADQWMRVSTVVPSDQVSSVINELGSLPDIFFIERVHRLGFFNDKSAGTIQSGTQGAQMAATPIWQQGIRGQGQIIGMIDTGADVDACWFKDTTSTKRPATNTWSSSGGYGTKVDASHRKIIAYDFLYSCDQYSSDRGCETPTDLTDWDTQGHGSHCAGSIIGESTTAGYNGMAPAAKMVVQDGGYAVNACADLPGIGCPVVDLNPIFEQAYKQGARIYSNSWGDNEDAPTPIPSNYSARSQDVDRFMWEHKDMLLIFAAGNSGTGNADFSVCSPSTNKSGLSIGSVRIIASAGDNDISSFSSRGWTADGRIKPELLTPGCTVSAGSDSNVESNNCRTDEGCGTSYACPIAAGAAALARQYFMDGFYPSGAKNAADALTPSGALLKAMLINSAVPVTGRDNAGQTITPIPSNEQGWGRIQLDRALLFKGAKRKLYVDDHKTGFDTGSKSANSYTITAVSPSEPIKITLAWTDYPGTVDSAPSSPKVDDPASFNPAQLVNDLDLVVKSGSDTYYGNVFSGGVSVKAGQADRRNTVEQVLLEKPVAGELTINVAPTKIAKAGQDYALVVTGSWDKAGPTAEPTDAGVADSGRGQAGASGAVANAGAGGSVIGAGGAQGPVGGGAGSQPVGTGSVAGSTAQPTTTGPVAGSSVPTDTNADLGPISSDGSTHSTECGCHITSRRTPGVNWLFVLAIGALILRIRQRHTRGIWAARPRSSDLGASFYDKGTTSGGRTSFNEIA